MAWARKWRNLSGTPTYFAWRSMRARCTDPNSRAWHNYGGRGITVCKRWAESYDAFYEDLGPRPDGATLERIDVNRGYDPDNCRWASWHEQANNKRTCVNVEFEGRTQTIAQWAAELDIEMSTLWRRLRYYNMSPERAMRAESLVRKTRYGTRHCYEKGCRCVDCKAAHAKRHREMRAKRKIRNSA